MKKKGLFLFLAPLLIGCATISGNNSSRCLFEGLAFSQFSNAVKNASTPKLIEGFDSKQIKHTIGEISLRGNIYTRKDKPAARTVIYVLQGNAIRHDTVANYWLQLIKEKNLNVSVVSFDYRGFRISDGEPSGEKLVSDVAALANTMGTKFENFHIYAQSFGVLLTLNAFEEFNDVDKIVLDSIPAKTPWVMGCPSAIQPINNIPPDSSKIMYLYGINDSQVPIESAERLASSIRENGGAALGVDGGHPSNSYQDFSARNEAIITFLELNSF